MKFDNKTFQQKYEAWKNGADYWKDIRGINLGGNTQAEEPSPEEQLQMDQNVQSILNAYDEGKDVNIAEDIIKPLPFDTPLNEEHPILHKYKGGKMILLILLLTEWASCRTIAEQIWLW